MEGAVRSGHSAAQLILDDISRGGQAQAPTPQEALA
jgi:hypothetical protein